MEWRLSNRQDAQLQPFPSKFKHGVPKGILAWYLLAWIAIVGMINSENKKQEKACLAKRPVDPNLANSEGIVLGVLLYTSYGGWCQWAFIFDVQGLCLASCCTPAMGDGVSRHAVLNVHTHVSARANDLSKARHCIGVDSPTTCVVVWVPAFQKSAGADSSGYSVCVESSRRSRGRPVVTNAAILANPRPNMLPRALCQQCKSTPHLIFCFEGGDGACQALQLNPVDVVNISIPAKQLGGLDTILRRAAAMQIVRSPPVDH
eukprot:1149214-Pelagomonas_calceolata.AAC.7